MAPLHQLALEYGGVKFCKAIAARYRLISNVGPVSTWNQLAVKILKARGTFKKLGPFVSAIKKYNY